MADQDPNKIFQETVETVSALKDAFNSLGAVIKAQLNNNITDADDIMKQLGKTIKSDLVSSLNQLGRASENVVDNALKLKDGQLSVKDITKQISDLSSINIKNQEAINRAVANNVLSEEQAVELQNKIKAAYEESLGLLEEQSVKAGEIEEKLGKLPDILKGISKIPILGAFVNTDKAIQLCKKQLLVEQVVWKYLLQD